MEQIKLTQYSHGAGCGCKIAPNILEQILHSNFAAPDNNRLLVGNHSKDDAAVYDIGGGNALISTTDFFMPIVDDPFQFGRIASANAISDVYAMGGTPILAIAILGWPINVLAPEIARHVIEGSRSICAEAGIPLAGGHSIDAPEPIFGLAVNGMVELANIKQNNTATEGDILFLTKPLGIGILTTAEKKGLLQDAEKQLAIQQMMQLNKVGESLGKLPGVSAMTDVTGFGLLGHLAEMCEGSGMNAEISLSSVPIISETLQSYLSNQCIPGGTIRNLKAYGHHVELSEGVGTDQSLHILADPQTSGGLLISAKPEAAADVIKVLEDYGYDRHTSPIGNMYQRKGALIRIVA